MKPINNSEIRRQQLLFTLSLLSVVIAVFLFTSAFYWSSNAERPWFNNSRQDQQVFKTSVKELSERIALLKTTLKEFEEMSAGNSISSREKETAFKNGLEAMVTDFDKYDKANKDEILLMKSTMEDVKVMLETNIANLKERSKFKSELDECKKDKTALETKLERCELRSGGL